MRQPDNLTRLLRSLWRLILLVMPSSRWYKKKSSNQAYYGVKLMARVSTFKCLKVETVSTFNWLKVETVPTFNLLKVETVSTFKHFHIGLLNKNRSLNHRLLWFVNFDILLKHFQYGFVKRITIVWNHTVRLH